MRIAVCALPHADRAVGKAGGVAVVCADGGAAGCRFRTAGRLGVVVTFLAILELAKEQLLDIVQEAPAAPIYLKSLAANNTNEPLQFSSEFHDSDAANDSP